MGHQSLFVIDNVWLTSSVFDEVNFFMTTHETVFNKQLLSMTQPKF